MSIEKIKGINENEAEEHQDQIEIIGVRFKRSGKIYYFTPGSLIVEIGMNVIVETARGVEYGNVVIPNRMVDYKEIITPLKKVIRIATEDDEIHHNDNGIKEKEAFNICFDKISDHNLDMKLIDVEYAFDNSKLFFYYTADGRIDFRELVKDLAGIFRRTRIELRQIGIRDEAKIMGGLGVCGRSFCCKTFLSDFIQVSIKMAKEQNLPLNSSKISGTCGRLMCCLRYEYDVYEEKLKKLPPLDSVVETPDGDGVVVEINVLAGLLKISSLRDPELPPKIYTSDNIKKVKGYMKKERDNNDDINNEELKELEKKNN